jgi:transcriptional regulator with XRE-family HTH domain
VLPDLRPQPADHMSSRLTNYLKTWRKRSGLTQHELAFLLGNQTAAQVSRFERQARIPNLNTAFSFQAIFDVPAHELLPESYRKAERSIALRADLLSHHLQTSRNSARKRLKLSLLSAVVARGGSGPQKYAQEKE